MPVYCGQMTFEPVGVPVIYICSLVRRRINLYKCAEVGADPIYDLEKRYASSKQMHLRKHLQLEGYNAPGVSVSLDD